MTTDPSTPRPILFCSVRLAAPRLPGRCVAGRLTSCRLRSSASETPAKPRQQSKPRRSQPRRATRSLTGRKSWHATCNTTSESPSSSLKKFVAATNGPGIPFARFRAFLLTRMQKQRAAANSKPGWVIAVVLTNLSERRLQQPQLWSLPRIPFLGGFFSRPLTMAAGGRPALRNLSAGGKALIKKFITIAHHCSRMTTATGHFVIVAERFAHNGTFRAKSLPRLAKWQNPSEFS